MQLLFRLTARHNGARWSGVQATSFAACSDMRGHSAVRLSSIGFRLSPSIIRCGSNERETNRTNLKSCAASTRNPWRDPVPQQVKLSLSQEVSFLASKRFEPIFERTRFLVICNRNRVRRALPCRRIASLSRTVTKFFAKCPAKVGC